LRRAPERGTVSFVRQLLVAAIALVSAVSITPGARELLLDVAHWTASGHLAHADACEDGEDGDEHGCTGTFHSCTCCHASAQVTVPRPMTLAAIVPAVREVAYARVEARRGPSGFTRPLIRPPSA
jgi:hypothetical protein